MAQFNQLINSASAIVLPPEQFVSMLFDENYSLRFFNSQGEVEATSSIPTYTASYAHQANDFTTGSKTLYGDLEVSGAVSASQFSGSGAQLYDISASAIVGLNLARISSGSATASIDPVSGFIVKSTVGGSTFSGSVKVISGSYSGSGAQLYDISASAIVGLNLSRISTGSYTASIDQTGSFRTNAALYVTNSTTPSGYDSTASIKTDGGMAVKRDAYFSSSVFIRGDLKILGTQSVQYITSSQLSIGVNIINLNTATIGSSPLRFGGLAVLDSGSTQVGNSGSFLWDSVNNRWISDVTLNATRSSAAFILGPENSGSLGSEAGINANSIPVGQGANRITSSLLTITRILSSSYSASVTSSVSESWLNVPMNMFLGNGDTSSIEITGSVGHIGDYVLTGSLSVTKSVNIVGSLSVSNSINLVGTQRVTGSLIVSNSVNVIGTQNITGSLIVSNSLNVVGTQRITGSLILSSSTDTVNLIGIQRITGSLVVSNSLDVVGTHRVTGSLIISNSLNVVGTQLVTGSLIISNSFTAIGAQTFSGSFLLTGSLTVSSSAINMHQRAGISGSNIFGTASQAETSSYNIQTRGMIEIGFGSSWTVPTGVSYFKVTAVGGGGGGGASSTANGNATGGGGGGVAVRIFRAVAGASVASYSIGAAGQGGRVTPGTAGTAGGGTSFTYNGVTITGFGGAGGVVGVGTGGAGGTATGGDINISGGTSPNLGSSAFSTLGQKGGSSSYPYGGYGGNQAALTYDGAVYGDAALGYGGGGAGGCSWGAIYWANGGNGRQGFILIEW